MTGALSAWLLEGAEAIVSSNDSIQTRHGNQITAYLEGRDYYQALAAAIATTQGGRGHFVLIAGWGFDEKTPLDPPVAGHSAIGALLDARSRQGVPVRALIWAHPDGSNLATVRWFGGLAGGGAIHDDRVLLLGSHHQKFCVVRGAAGVVGFCGGMDVGSNRLKDGPFDRPWHDVQVSIIGPAAVDLWRTFFNRWIEQADLAVGRNGIDPPMYPLMPPPTSSGQSAQILRTFGNGSRHLGLNVRKLPSEAKVLGQFRWQSRTYQFAPLGERSIYHLLIKAIRAARTSIYLEDQYLVASEPISGEPSLGWELARTMSRPSFKGMIILTNGVGTVQGELFQVNDRRSRFWKQINLMSPGKVSVWAYKGGPTSPYWMHSKMWVFDDTLAVVGSANSNRRGYCHDSEIAAAVLDVNAAERLPFAHELRVRLWLKHLNSRKQRVTRNEVIDFAQGMQYWVDGGDTDLARISPTVPDSNHVDHPILASHDGLPPRGSFKALLQEAEREVIPAMGRADWRDFEWDYLIDPDGG